MLSADVLSRPRTRTIAPAVKQAEVLGVSVRTMEKWIDKYVQSTESVRIAQGIYNKRGAKIT